jgi:phage terminase small subunit
MKIRIDSGHLRGLPVKEATFVIEYVKDFAPRRAAEAAGYAADWGYELMKLEQIQNSVTSIVMERLDVMNIDAEWVLYELVDNHRIARQQGNVSASNTALVTIAKHIDVDALAKQRIEIDDVSDRELLQRLQDGRKRMNKTDDEVSFI